MCFLWNFNRVYFCLAILPCNLVSSTCLPNCYPRIFNQFESACFSGDQKRQASVFPDVDDFRLMGHNCDIVADGIDARIDELERASE